MPRPALCLAVVMLSLVLVAGTGQGVIAEEATRIPALP